MSKPALLLLLVLAGAGIPLDCLADTGAETFLAPDIASTPDSAFRPDSALVAVVVSTPDSVSAPESGAARDSASATDSASGPDPARIATLLFVMQGFNEMRVVTDGAKLVRRNPVVSPEGLRLRSASREFGLEARPEERLVPWSEIESIQVRRGARDGVVVGAVVGLAIGFSIYAVEEIPKSIFSLGEEHASGTPVLVGLVGGALLGWLIDHPGPWRTVYP